MAQREAVLASYNAAKKHNQLQFMKGDEKATDEYIYPNQTFDAAEIVHMFYNSKCRVVGVQKKTKVGADGLMIEIAKLLTTHNDDNFVVDLANVRIITGMSNVIWEKDMIDKTPDCFRNNIYHHGKLKRARLNEFKNGLIIIDEIDSGDKEYQVLHMTLKNAGLLDVQNMVANNNRFVIISATMIRELYDLYSWGDLHRIYTMTIPSSYVGHTDFLNKGIVKEFYALDTIKQANKWIQEDINDNYGHDYRVHIVRLNNKNIKHVEMACQEHGILFMQHNSTDKLPVHELKHVFEDTLCCHVVIVVKGLLRRANFIPNKWKLRIGVIHELFTNNVDNNVQVQGLIGRMTGYWRYNIENGHKTGPYRTSIKAIIEYEQTYNDPFGKNSYKTSTLRKSNGKVARTTDTLLSAKHIANLQATSIPSANCKTCPIIIVKITDEIALTFNKNNNKYIRKAISDHDPEIMEKYDKYKPHYWRITTEDQINKWGIKNMYKDGAHSSITNIKMHERDIDVIIFYLHNNNLLLYPWNGTKK